MRKSVVILLAGLAACSPGKETMQRVIKQSAKDPESIKFRDYIEVSGKTTDFACIEVNGKNSFGGYTGYQAFRATHEKKSEDWDVDGKPFDTLDECRLAIEEAQRINAT